MADPNALHLDAYDEDWSELYMDGSDLSVETVQRMIVYGESALARPQDVSVLEEEWGDWWALVAVFIEVYAPHVLPYRKLAPLTWDSVDELSPADRRYLNELITALRMYVQRRLA